MPALKRFLLSNRPLPQGFINPAIGASLQKLVFENLDESINELNDEIQDYIKFIENDDNVTTLNVTFGKLN